MNIRKRLLGIFASSILWQCGFVQPALALAPPVLTPTNSVCASKPRTFSVAAVSGVSFYYTLDGSDPDNTDNLYTSPVTISKPTQVKVVAYQTGTYSSIASIYIEIDPNLIAIEEPGGTTPPAPILWYKSEFGVETTTTNNPPRVQKWIDFSGNGKNASASTTATAPELIISSSYPNVLNFRGSNFLSVPSGFSSFSGTTIFMVAAPASDVDLGAVLFDIGNSGTGNDILFRVSSSSLLGQFGIYSGTTSSFATANSTAGLNPNTLGLWEAVSDGITHNGNFLFNSDKGANTSLNAIASVTRSSNFIGKGNVGTPFRGRISEIIFYNTKLTDQQRSTIEAYLISKYQTFSLIPKSPIFSIQSGTLAIPSKLSLTTESGAEIFYTTDGSTPGITSKRYSGAPININYSQTIKAIASKNGVTSGVVSHSYTLDSQNWKQPQVTDPAPTLTIELPTESN